MMKYRQKSKILRRERQRKANTDMGGFNAKLLRTAEEERLAAGNLRPYVSPKYIAP